jgi:hypothetical protein
MADRIPNANERNLRREDKTRGWAQGAQPKLTPESVKNNPGLNDERNRDLARQVSRMPEPILHIAVSMGAQIARETENNLDERDIARLPGELVKAAMYEKPRSRVEKAKPASTATFHKAADAQRQADEKYAARRRQRELRKAAKEVARKPNGSAKTDAGKFLYRLGAALDKRHPHLAQKPAGPAPTVAQLRAANVEAHAVLSANAKELNAGE